MQHVLAACPATGTWAQKWACGWHEPVNTSVTQAGHATGSALVPALAVALILLVVVSLVRRKPGRPAATKG